MPFLSDKAVKEFQKIYKKKCGEISFEEARTKAEDFLKFFALITKPNKISTKEDKDH